MPISEQDKQRLQYIATLIEANKLAEAKNHLSDLLKNSPPSAPAWYLVSLTLTEMDKQRTALERSLAIDPNYAPAQKALKRLKSDPRSSQRASNQPVRPDKSNRGNIPLPIALLSVVLVLLIVGGGVFLVVKPDAVADVKTFVATVRATPIGTPLVFSTTQIRGEAIVEMHAGSDDLQGGGRTDFTLQGIGAYGDYPDVLAFTLIDDQTLERWQFEFYESTYIEGRTYEKGLNVVQYIPGGTSIHCPKVSANYKFEREGDGFIITFSRRCNEDSRQWLDGVLHFTPTSMLTLTPTIPPDQLFDFNAYPGSIRLELNSWAGDPIGEGKGDIVLETTGELQRIGENKPYGYKFIAPTIADKWELLFWARSIQVNTRYEAHNLVFNAGHGRLPEMNIRHPVRDLKPCPSVNGHFTVEQQSPTIIISFEQHCNKDANQVLRGRLIFTPDLTYTTPTPTNTPTRIFYPSRTPGPPPTRIAPSAYLFPTWTPIPDAVAANATPAAVLQDQFTQPIKGHVELKNEWIGRVARFQTSQGDGKVTSSTDDQLTITFIDSKTKELWFFNFFGTRFATGQTYEHVRLHASDAEQKPSMSITKSGVFDVLCNDLDGSFRFDQQGADLVVTFTQLCSGNDLMSLQGTIRFTPN